MCLDFKLNDNATPKSGAKLTDSVDSAACHYDLQHPKHSDSGIGIPFRQLENDKSVLD